MFLLLVLIGCAPEDGIDGRDGRDGAPGATGPAGADGADGADGIDGDDSPLGPHWVDAAGAIATLTAEAVHVDDEGLVWYLDTETGAAYGYGAGPLAAKAPNVYASGAACAGTLYVSDAPSPRVPFHLAGGDSAWFVRPDDLALSTATSTAYQSYGIPGACYSNSPGIYSLIPVSEFERRGTLAPPNLGLLGPLHLE